MSSAIAHRKWRTGGGTLKADPQRHMTKSFSKKMPGHCYGHILCSKIIKLGAGFDEMVF
jgi:hypothetical protein